MTSRTVGERTIVWVAADESSNDIDQLLPGKEHRIELCRKEGLQAQLEWQVREGTPPTAIVIDSSVESPLRVARHAYRLSPLSQLIFLVVPGELDRFRAQMPVAPMIGTYWTIVEREPRQVSNALDSAGKVGRQRRNFRTNLEKINVRLGAHRPPSDSAEYRKLVISDKYLATILEHAQDAIVSLDPAGRIASWNRGAVKIFGYDVDTALNRRLEDLLASDYREPVQKRFQAALRGDSTVQMEADCLREDDRPLTAEITLAPVRDEAGEIVAISLTARDVTERKRDEEELRRIREELEQRVEQRTQDLQSVNRELEAFTYSASHDLRAPLRGIDGFSQALLEDYGEALDENGKRFIERIRAAAGRMGEIIDALLLLSRISRSKLEFQAIDFTTMAREVLAELSEREPHREATVSIEEGLWATGDYQLLRIVMENLLSNAWKFTREREQARIEVGRDRDAPGVVFFVRDNGAGFDMAYSEKLFEPFQRLHHPVRFEGTGIGLGTVQRIVARHGGKVWAQSAPDQGATFYFSLATEGSTAN